MKLKTVHVRMFRNILDSTEVGIDSKVTCLVGKNESGKSAFLTALWRLNPARMKPAFTILEHYPAWLEKRHRIEGIDQKGTRAVEACFEWEPADVSVIEKMFGAGVVSAGATLRLSKTYENEFNWESACSEEQAVNNFVRANQFPQPARNDYLQLVNFESLKVRLSQDIDKSAESPDDLKLLSNVQAAMTKLLGEGDNFDDATWEAASERIPEFFYFADYSKLPYSVKIQDVLKGGNLEDAEATARALLRLGGTDDEYMLNPDYERRKRELENVANALTQDVNEYWSQNPELRVQPDITQTTVADQQGRRAVVDELKLRIWDNRHSLTLPFTEHSAGFQWFFSFLAAFSEYEKREPPVVILLDEPAVGLHARAQADFLRFIEERLAKRCQVVYTTHSPFMVQPGKLERVRLVEDLGKERGATVSSDVLTRDRDTLFPLQGALGYDLVQHLFVAKNNIVVEGTSDYAYLKLVSDFLASKERTHLDPRWSIVPVGGADLIPTFVALLGGHLKVTVLVDSRKEGHQKLERMARDGYLERQRIIFLGDILGRKTGDIEDLFEKSEYVQLYNAAFGKKLDGSQLASNDPIVSGIARVEGIDRFDHGRPADVLLRDRDRILPTLCEETLSRFESLFSRINETISI